SQGGPVAFLLIVLVGDGAFDDEDEWTELAFRCLVEGRQKRVADLVSEDRVVQSHFRQAGDGAEENILDAGLGRGHDGDRVAVTTQAGRQPEDVDGGNRGSSLDWATGNVTTGRTWQLGHSHSSARPFFGTCSPLSNHAH